MFPRPCFTSRHAHTCPRIQTIACNNDGGPIGPEGQQLSADIRAGDTITAIYGCVLSFCSVLFEELYPTSRDADWSFPLGSGSTPSAPQQFTWLAVRVHASTRIVGIWNGSRSTTQVSGWYAPLVTVTLIYSKDSSMATLCKYSLNPVAPFLPNYR